MFDLRPVRRNNSVAYYDPFRAMDEFERRFFNEPFASSFDDSVSGLFSTDIKDEGANYVLEADLPGFNKEDISIDLNGDQLTISAVRHSDKEDRDQAGKFVRSERSYGSYKRSFDISAIDASGIEAAYVNGVLTLTMPKKAEVVPEARRLEIK